MVLKAGKKIKKTPPTSVLKAGHKVNKTSPTSVLKDGNKLKKTSPTSVLKAQHKIKKTSPTSVLKTDHKVKKRKPGQHKKVMRTDGCVSLDSIHDAPSTLSWPIFIPPKKITGKNVGDKTLTADFLFLFYTFFFQTSFVKSR